MSEDKTMVQQCFSEIGKRFSKMERSLKRLPYDAELEYIEFPDISGVSNYAIVHLPIYVISCIDIYAEWYLPNGGTRQDCALVGKWTSSGSNYVSVESNNNFFAFHNSTKQINDRTVAPIGEWFSVSLSGNTVTCNNTSFSISTNNFVNKTQLMDIQGSSNCRMRRVILSLCDITLFDLIPVRLEETAYFFDKLSNRFFNSDTAAQLICGPDK